MCGPLSFVGHQDAHQPAPELNLRDQGQQSLIQTAAGMQGASAPDADNGQTTSTLGQAPGLGTRKDRNCSVIEAA